VFDLFLSYRRSDAPRAQPMLDALQALGVSFWRDTREIEDFGSVQQAINDGLTNSRALLVWYSGSYNASRACQWELTAGYLAAQADAATAGGPRRRIFVVNPESGSGHIHLPELFDQQYLSAPAPGDAAALQQLAERLHAALAQVPVQALGALRAFTQPSWYPYATPGSNRFVGRLAEMWRIHAELQKDQAAMLTGSGGKPGLAQVRGAGGIGKSLLAEEYALRFGAAYPGGVFWLRAFGHPDGGTELSAEQRAANRDSQILSFAAHLGFEIAGLKSDEVIGRLRHHFERGQKRFLWVVDDLPPEPGPGGLSAWLAPHPLGRTLFTTRARRFNHVTAIELPQLDADDAYQLLTRQRQLSPQDGTDAREICKQLGYHALAVDVAAALVERRGYAGFLLRLNQPDQDALELAAKFGEALPNGHERHIAATFLASIRQLDEPARDLLRLAATLAAAPIPRELQWRCLADADQLNDDDAQDTCDLAADQLRQHSLTDDAGDGACVVHTLITRTIRFHDPQPERIRVLRTAAVTVLNNKLPAVQDIRNHETLADWVTHAREISEAPQDVENASLLGFVAQYDLTRGQYQLAYVEFERELGTLRQLLKENDLLILQSMGNFAHALTKLGKIRDARVIQENIIARCHAVFANYNEFTLRAMNDLALTLRSQGYLFSARVLLEKILHISNQLPDHIIDKRHSLILMLKNNLASTLRDLGEFSSAKDLQAIVIEEMISTHGSSHPDTIKCKNNLALTLWKMNNLPAAEKLQREVLLERQQLFGTKHPATLSAMNNLAETLSAQGDLTGAKELQQAAFDIINKALGTKNPQTCSAAWNLFNTLFTTDKIAAKIVLTQNLLWLLNENQKNLTSDLAKIRHQLPKYINSLS
jgi:tetratricopeptide (TPR) repeat protein